MKFESSTRLTIGLIASMFFAFSAHATLTVLELYRDVAPGAPGGDPGLGAVFNGELFFEAEVTGAGDEEPFRFDGTTLVQIPNASPPGGGADSNLTSQFVFNNRLYAVMESNVGRELYEYNTGTQQYVIHTNLNGAGDGFPIPMKDVNGDAVIFGGHMLFSANNGPGRRIYRLRSDNNVFEPLPGATAIGPSNLAVFGGNLYYEADDGGGNDEPFRLVGATQTQITNGSPPGGGADSNLTSQFVFNGRLYAVMESNVGRELFEYNAGTNTYNLHTNLNGAGDGFPIPATDEDGDAVIYGTHMLFSANNGPGRRVFRLRSDTNVLEQLPGATAIGPSNYAIFGGDLYYEAETGAGDDEPWRLSGGTLTQITNANPRVGDSNLTAQFVFLGDLYAVMESNTGRELFKYDPGTTTYSRMLDLNGAGDDGFPIPIKDVDGGIVIYQSAMMIEAEDTGIDRELFRLRAVAVPPSIGINDVAITEGNAGTSNLNFTVTRSNNTSAVSVNYATANGTAVAGGDFVTTNGTLNFTNGGPLSLAVSVPIVGDTMVELNETFVVNLSNPTNGATLSDSQGVGTINNNDAATLSINDVAISEGNAGTTNLTFSTTLSAAVDVGISVNAASANNTATTADGDYAANSGTLNFTGTAGEVETFTVLVSGDTTVELNETLLVNLTGLSASGRNVSVADAQGVGTINNDDAATLSINDVAISEGNAGTTNLTFSTTLSAAVDVAISVNAASADNTATTADGDYVANSGALNFAGAAGEVESFTVQVGGDTTLELNETFFVNLTGLSANGRNVSVSDAQGLGTINNDDAASLSINDVTVTEGNTGTTNLIFTATLVGDVDSGFSVDATAVDSTATIADGDFNNSMGTLNFAGNNGETQNFTVQANGDTQVELDEALLVNLTNVQAGGRNITLSDPQGQGTLTNDDTATLSIADLSINEGNAGTTSFDFVVTLSAAVDAGLAIDAASADGTATTAANDYTANAETLNFVGNAGETQNFTVLVNGDTTVEANETFSALLSNLQANGRDVSIADGTAEATILNDDSASVSIADVSINEGDAGTTNMVFDVTLAGSVKAGFSVDFATAAGTATVGSDFTANSGTLNFLGTPNETQTVTVLINGDGTTELDETLLVNLSNLNAPDVTLSDAQGEGTIINDDAATLVVNDLTQAEGDAGTTNYTFAVSLDSDVDTGFAVDITSTDGTATTAGNDYTANNATLNFAGTSGEVQTFTVLVNGDVIVEPTETFTVDLSNVVAAGRDVSIADGQGVGTISNDDSSNLNIDDASQNEGAAGAANMTFTVTLGESVKGGFTVDYASTHISTDGADLALANGTLNFVGTMGETQTIDVSINGDGTVELDETFRVNLSNVSLPDVMIGDGEGIGTVVNDDSAGFSIDDVTITEGASPQMVFTVTLDQAVDVPVAVDFNTADGTATVADGDYIASNGTLNFVGNAGETQTVTVSVNDDLQFEVDETFVVDLSNVQAQGRDVSLLDSQGVGTLGNNDPELVADKAAIFTGPLGATDVVTYQVDLTHTGPDALAVMFTDTPDAQSTLIAGSVVTTQGTVTQGNNPGDGSITVDVGDLLAPNNSVTITYDVRINANVNAGASIDNQGLFSGSTFADLLTNDPATAAPGDVTSIPVGVMQQVPTLGFWATVLLAAGFLVLVLRRERRRLR